MATYQKIKNARHFLSKLLKHTNFCWICTSKPRSTGRYATPTPYTLLFPSAIIKRQRGRILSASGRYNLNAKYLNLNRLTNHINTNRRFKGKLTITNAYIFPSIKGNYRFLTNMVIQHHLFQHTYFIHR